MYIKFGKYKGQSFEIKVNTDMYSTTSDEEWGIFYNVYFRSDLYYTEESVASGSIIEWIDNITKRFKSMLNEEYTDLELQLIESGFKSISEIKRETKI